MVDVTIMQALRHATGTARAHARRLLSAAAFALVLCVAGCDSTQTADVTEDTTYHGNYVIGGYYQTNHDLALVDWRVLAEEMQAEVLPIENNGRFALYPLDHETIPDRAVIGHVPAGTTVAMEKVLFKKQSGVQKVDASLPMGRLINGDHAGKAVAVNGISQPWFIRDGKIYRWDPKWLTYAGGDLDPLAEADSY